MYITYMAGWSWWRWKFGWNCGGFCGGNVCTSLKLPKLIWLNWLKCKIGLWLIYWIFPVMAFKNPRYIFVCNWRARQLMFLKNSNMRKNPANSLACSEFVLPWVSKCWSNANFLIVLWISTARAALHGNNYQQSKVKFFGFKWWLWWFLCKSLNTGEIIPLIRLNKSWEIL